MIGLVRQDLVDYLGSRHSAVGLILAFLGLPALIGGVWMAIGEPEITRWLSVPTAIWGAVSLPLGISMRRTKPPQPLWILACLLYAVGLLTMAAVLLDGKP